MLAAPPLTVALDPEFPRVVSYTVGDDTLTGQPSPVRAVEINGKAAACRVTFSRKTLEAAVYRLEFPAEGIALEMTAHARPDHLDMGVTRLEERGAVKLKTLAFPGNALLTVPAAATGAALAACHATNTHDRHQAVFREKIAPLTALKPGQKDTGNYLFLSAGLLAAGIGCSNFTDVQRTAWEVVAAEGGAVLAAGNPVWEFRKYDDEPADSPWVKVFVTPDLNADAKADWQDAAIAFRRGMPKPFGHETVKTLVGENIAMNFASGAQQPFLKILDSLKKIYLATDGLPNQVNIKGFSSEGHDSANTDYAGHWNERAGGLRDLSFLLERAASYNARVGIHINASEVYPEARRYRPEILQRDAQGRPVGGWTWLDHAHMIDKEKDVRSGQLFKALEQMRAALPKLDFVYVDTYWDNGWPAAQIARKINSLGLAMYSEGDCCLDPWIVWGHWRGAPHTIQRFLWFSDRDLFANDPILRAGRADGDGFMGWQNQHNFHSFISRTFAARLPAKFLQHFELLRWVPGERAEFSGGVTAVKSGDKVTVTQDGRVLMTWTGGGDNPELFVPWPPEHPEKVYVWSDSGNEIVRELPPGWPAADLALYQLNDRGRTNTESLAAKDGKLILMLPFKSPFVLYPRPAPPPPAPHYGEGGPVVNPGFDSYDLTGWEPVGGNGGDDGARVAADKLGNPRLVLPGTARGVSQRISGLQPGQSYAATVWALTSGGRFARLEVTSGGQTVACGMDKSDVRHSAPNDPRTGTHYRRLRVVFTATDKTAQLTLAATPGAPDAVMEFDDVRIVETAVSPEAAKHTFWEDFEHVESGGYGPFTCCPGEHTHLSEANPPHTRDTIRGRFSLKSRDSGQVLRTLPTSLPLKPATRYRLACQTIGQGRLTVISKGRPVATFAFPNLPDYQAGPVTGEFVTRDDPDSYLALFRDGGDMIVLDDLAIDELRPATAAEIAAAAQVAAGPPIPDDKLPGHRVVLEDTFAKAPAGEWKLIPSKHPGTFIGIRDGALAIDAYANISILAERPLPPDTAAVETRLTVDGDQGQTWGPGLTLVWPGGQQVRVNLRPPDRRFGIDSTAAGQQITGNLSSDAAALRIRIDGDVLVCEARCAGDAGWQRLAAFPRAKFPGAPAAVRLGKTHAVEALDDHIDLGPIGTTRYGLFRTYAK